MRHPTTTVPRRNIPILAAFAILGVVLNHATWQVLGSLPPGDPRGYGFLPLDQIGKIAIPVFLFTAGYFAAYATSGGRKPLAWSVVRTRIRKLFSPWVVWAVLWLGMHILAGNRSPTLKALFEALFAQYYFIPMLMTYYLLAPLMVALARRNARSLLLLAASLQLLGLASFYLQTYTPLFHPPEWVDIIPLQYLRFAIYFPFGLVVGMRPAILAPMVRWRARIPWLTLLAFGLANLEGGLAYRRSVSNWYRADSHIKGTSMLFSLGVLFCFMLYEQVQVPTWAGKGIRLMSTSTYGIYLSHYVVIAILKHLSALTGLSWAALPAGWAYVLALTALTIFLCLRMIQFSTRFRHVRAWVFG